MKQNGTASISIPAFNRELDTFCGKYMFSNRPVSPTDEAAFPTNLLQQSQGLFEQFLLFDSVAFKISGENLVLPILISQFGIKGVEQLMEEDAVRFVLWTQDVLRFVTDTPGVNPLVTMKHNSEAHSEPDKSVELGLRFMSRPIPDHMRRRFAAKAVALYEPQPENLAVDAAKIAQSAFEAGRLSVFGLKPEDAPLQNMPLAMRARLHDCAVELLEYKLMMAKNWTSLSSFTYFALFSDSLRRLTEASSVVSGFRHLAEIEDVPDFATLYQQINTPLKAVLKIRSKKSSRQFRRWLADGAQDSPTELTRRYIEAISETQGFFARPLGKVVKGLAMTATGAGLGAAIEGGLQGAAAGGAVGKVLEPAADFGLDLIDRFLLDGLLKGWTPKVFFNKLDQEHRRLVGKQRVAS